MLRALLATNLIVALIALVNALQQGNTRVATNAGFSIIAGLALWWAVTLSRIWPLVIVVGTASAVFGSLNGQPWVGLLVAFGFASLAGWYLSRPMVAASSVKPAEGVDAGAQQDVDAFVTMGYSLAGTISFEVARTKTVRANLMIGPGGDRYAVVTDLVLVIISVFGSKTLVSRNSAMASLLPSALANDLQGASAGELARSHQAALDLLAEHGLTPDRIDTSSLVETHMEREKQSIAAAAGTAKQRLQASLRSGAGEGPLTESATAHERLLAWQAQV